MRSIETRDIETSATPVAGDYLTIRVPDAFRSGRGPIELRLDEEGRFSEAEFWELCQANPDVRLERMADGRVTIMAPAGADGDRRNVALVARLYIWNEIQGQGIVLGPSAGLTMPDGSVMSPDASWIRQERWQVLSAMDRQRFSHVVPDFVAEIVSPSQAVSELQPKLRAYLRHGVSLGWLLDPLTRSVEIHRPGRVVQVLTRPESLDGGDVLPGLVVPMRGILFD